MQVANTLNNSIRILFNPRVENFKLFDFLIVKSDDNRYVAQVVEIYDDKFDASQNVAKIKLFYRITENNEVMPYDNFTPNKECEISKVKPEEIEAFINQDKETFILGTNIKNNCSLNIQYDFFNNNAVVLADKIENANAITFNLAKKLSQKRNVVIIDTTSALEMDGAVKIKANKNFKMPLNYSTIDHIFNRCLYDASLEFQAIGGEIINEIKKFARKQENEFIPFNLLTRVLIQQHKATPYPELKLLLTRLKKYQMDEIFARTKNEKEALAKSISKNPITIIDLSDLDNYWQKTYIDYIITSLEQEIYLTTRVNDELFDADLINKIYNKKKNIKFVPTVSYNYKKLPTIMQQCKNYILMPSLIQRADFLDANFALSNLISEGCIVFGENTDNFLYMVRDYELEVQEKRKNYRKIALTLVQQDAQQNLGEKGDYFENKNSQEMTDSARLIKELSDFEASQKLKMQKEENSESQETFEEIENPKVANEPSVEEAKVEVENDLVFNNEENFEEIEVQTQEEENVEEVQIDEQQEAEAEIVQEVQEEVQEEEKSFKSIIVEEEQEEIQKEEIIEGPSQEEEKNEIIEEKQEEVPPQEFDDIPILEDDDNEQEMDLSDEELDFFQMAQDSEDKYQEDDEQEEDDDIDLSAIADSSIDNNFEDIINSKNQPASETIELDDNTSISADILNTQSQKENLPIFKNEEKTSENTRTYAIGDVVVHKNYGKGKVVKQIKHEDRQFLRIEFEDGAARVLDAEVANLKLEQ